MDWKEFFKPNKKKILFSILLIIISAIVFIFPIFPLTYSPVILIYSVPALFIPIILILSYIFGCYMSRSKKWFLSPFMYLFAFIVVSVLVFFGISMYNDTFGRYCETDSDCRFSCGEGAISNKYISLMDFSLIDCFGYVAATCENNRCQVFRFGDITSPEDCERIKGQYGYEYCYYTLAEELNDTSVCNLLEGAEGAYGYENCYYNIARKLNDTSVCNQLEDQKSRQICLEFLEY